MTSSLQQKTIVEPELGDVFSIFKQDLLSSLNCIKIGRIQTYDSVKHSAQVQILFKRVLPDLSVKSYPLLIDVPVVTLQGGGGALQLPIAAGDQCLLLFSDRRIDEWYQNGGEAAPASPRLHDMSDAIALVGLNALNSPLPATPTNKVTLSYQGQSVELGAATASLIATGGAEINLATLVEIKNSTTSLLILLSAFIDVLKTLQVNGPIPLTAASIAALEAFKLQFATLLE